MLRETPGLYSICRELERLADKIELALVVGLRDDPQARSDIQALIRHNKVAVKIYEGK